MIKTSNDIYIDIGNTLLYTRSSILKRDGSKIVTASPEPAETWVAPINYFHSTQFKNIEVYINGKLISTSDNLSAYRSYIECLLNYSKEAKDGQLSSALFYKDTGNDHDWFDTDVDDIDGNQNTGLHYRFKRTKHSRSFETIGRIHSELFLQNRMIPGGNEIRIRFTRHDPSFSLHSKSTDNSTYIINTDVAMLMVRQCDIAPHIVENHLKTLQRHTLKFPIKKIRMKFFTRVSGRNDLYPNRIL